MYLYLLGGVVIHTKSCICAEWSVYLVLLCLLYCYVSCIVMSLVLLLSQQGIVILPHPHPQHTTISTLWPPAHTASHPQHASTPPTHPQLAVSLLPALKIQQEMLFVLISVMVACMLEELLKPETPSVKAITPAETEIQPMNRVIK